jgi:inner membrane protein
LPHGLFGRGAEELAPGRIIGGLLAGLYAVLYVLLRLEAYSLLIGSALLFLVLGTVMFATRNLNWGGAAASEAVAA